MEGTADPSTSQISQDKAGLQAADDEIAWETVEGPAPTAEASTSVAAGDSSHLSVQGSLH